MNWHRVLPRVIYAILVLNLAWLYLVHGSSALTPSSTFFVTVGAMYFGLKALRNRKVTLHPETRS